MPRALTTERRRERNEADRNGPFPVRNGVRLTGAGGNLPVGAPHEKEGPPSMGSKFFQEKIKKMYFLAFQNSLLDEGVFFWGAPV